tara:strand:+ start:475 stop:816 length:342 start_codon:yes stop_codon:yes gene_type:complete
MNCTCCNALLEEGDIGPECSGCIAHPEGQPAPDYDPSEWTDEGHTPVDNMLPQSVIDGIINYADAAVREHSLITTEKGRYVKQNISFCNDKILTVTLIYENRVLEEWEKDGDE